MELKEVLTAAGIMGVCATIIAIPSCSSVEEGHRGVKVTFGKVSSDEALTPGLNFKAPFVSSIKSIDVRTQLHSGKINTLTSDMQPADIMFDLNYNIDPHKVVTLYKEIGRNYEEIVIKKTVLQTIQGIIGKTKADDLINKRADAQDKILNTLKQQLIEKGIEATSFGFSAIDFTPGFLKAIENKEIARQSAIEESHKTERIKELAKQDLETAKGSAQALKEIADAEAYAIEVRANATQKPGALGLETIKKWDGRVPVVVGGGDNILDISALMLQSKTPVKVDTNTNNQVSDGKNLVNIRDRSDLSR
ncbi:MAG: prohibitin family protein [Lactobacillales bacterium]|jgi:regulator of protease activity HflC (stomatin/prohibitin superfamily)|nr:prohibitin family protein [Lactobacillales bacterium]